MALEPHAERDLDKLPKEIFSKIDKTIFSLARNPRPFGVKKLDQTLHRVRFRDWRIVYAILDKEARVVILRVVRRNEKTYKGF
ncbi:MAG: type II toxin-antitoxin system RelE/ParE family toxin [Candidatus Omnitrophica bacterium]|nr:type II toxin-antitoxin system RelE/ParE family toxin [Candidatus Omnitrophota bacterium]